MEDTGSNREQLWPIDVAATVALPVWALVLRGVGTKDVVGGGGAPSRPCRPPQPAVGDAMAKAAVALANMC